MFPLHHCIILQLYEYMAMREGGATTWHADDALSKYSLAQAESIWPQLKISS